MNERLGLLGRLRAYKLDSNLIVLSLLILSVTTSVVIYVLTDTEFARNLALAISTSLLASVFVLISDIYVKFRNFQNDIFLEGVERLGISNLHFNKRELLAQMMLGCEHAFWASGYRLILTSGLTSEIERVSQKKVEMRFLCTPPWEAAFDLVYGNADRVMNNYYKVFDAVLRGSEGAPTRCDVRFSSKPLFNDTYRIDRQLVTGPYMHNRDPIHGRITANDFFTYELHRQSQLHQLVNSEFQTIWADCSYELDRGLYMEASRRNQIEDLTDQQKKDMLRAACREIPAGRKKDIRSQADSP